jgi:hypothetical protein
MATRSTIALEFADGTVQQVYCHWDGYLEHNGAILFNNYQDPFKLRDLIDLGDISSLGINIGSKHPFSPHGDGDQAAYDAAKEAGATTFYGRDRGETGVAAKKFADFADYVANHQYEEFEYILRKDGNWYVSKYNGPYALLKDAIEQAAMKEAA